MRLGKLSIATLLPFGLLSLSASFAQAQITKTGGTANLSLLFAPASVRPGAHTSNKNLFLFDEQQNINVTDLLTDTGSITGSVNSYMLYTDATGLAGPRTYDITVTSAQKILGIITTSGLLRLSDNQVGLANTLYPDLFTGVLTRGQEGADYAHLTTDYTLTIHNVTFGNVDEIRIITAVPELSTLLGFGSFVALGGLAAFRQRKTARKAA